MSFDVSRTLLCDWSRTFVCHGFHQQLPLKLLPHVMLQTLSHSNLMIMSALQPKCVMFKLLGGLCNLDKYLPLHFMSGLMIELELVSGPLEPIIHETFTAAAQIADDGTALYPARPARKEVRRRLEINISTALVICCFIPSTL